VADKNICPTNIAVVDSNFTNNDIDFESKKLIKSDKF